MRNESKYLAICYAAWLGKIIGVRLGAPVENWSAEQIANRYPSLDGYLVDYGVFAADDDTNGPAFFVRALLDDSKEISLPIAVGHALLNYIPDHTSFFWWGGTGVSTEQTAYENLMGGILPPASGSIAQNGRILAEQIGGQIFSDCWGYVSLFHPKRAADMAEQASSVTHDGEALQGARFIAASIAIAAEETQAMRMILRALRYIKPESVYAHMVRDVCGFYREHPADWRACLAWIDRQYDRAQYGGVCHIIPNAARIILSLCYGRNDFTATLSICCACGFDTDCNCGNVGSIMGALCGIAGIPEKWIVPINDVLLFSSCLGYENNGTVSGSARLFADLAKRLREGKAGDGERDAAWRFTLPYETKGALAMGGAVRQADGVLLLYPQESNARVFWRSYYRPSELYDARYEPMLSPLVHPGETVRFLVSASARTVLQPFAEIDSIGEIMGQPLTVGSAVAELAMPVPAGDGTVLRFGLRVSAGTPATISIRSVVFDHRADCAIRFAERVTDDYGPRFSGGRHRVVRGFVAHSGEWQLQDGALLGCSRREALITTGGSALPIHTVSATMTPDGGAGCFVVFGLRGARRYVACGIESGELLVLKRTDETDVILASRPAPAPTGVPLPLTVRIDACGVNVLAGGISLHWLAKPSWRPPCGAVGFLLRGAGQCSFRTLRFQS